MRTNLWPINPVYYTLTGINQSFQSIINDKYRINLNKDNSLFPIYSFDVGNKVLVIKNNPLEFIVTTCSHFDDSNFKHAF